MPHYEYTIWVQRTEQHEWFELCRCEAVDSVCYVIRAILERSKSPPRYVKVESVECL